MHGKCLCGDDQCTGLRHAAKPSPEIACSACAEAWHIIDKLLIGMLISDPRWSSASKWLSDHRPSNKPNTKGSVSGHAAGTE